MDTYSNFDKYIDKISTFNNKELLLPNIELNQTQNGILRIKSQELNDDEKKYLFDNGILCVKIKNNQTDQTNSTDQFNDQTYIFAFNFSKLMVRKICSIFLLIERTPASFV